MQSSADSFPPTQSTPPTTPPGTSPPTHVIFTLHDDATELRHSVYDTLHLIDGDSPDKPSLLKNPSEEPVSHHQQPKFRVFRKLEDHKGQKPKPPPNAYIRWIESPFPEEEEDLVEYEVDEEDVAWLKYLNLIGGTSPPVSVEVFELLMDRLEKQSYLHIQNNASVDVDVGAAASDEDAVCCICMDGDCQNSNAILFCDMCNLAVHQDCYGVPNIPEGQWFCCRCSESPSRDVHCALCPNKGGAFKQTDDGRWAHVVCARWIPEVDFGCYKLLEPIESLEEIPRRRFRLCCFICKERGACIQCYKPSCVTAFHVTCAQFAGLYLKLETIGEPNGIYGAYCNSHRPVDSNSPSSQQKLIEFQKKLAENRSSPPIVFIPTVSPDSLTLISQSAENANAPSDFLKRLLSYWKLKRIQRNGRPLLRSLQAVKPPVLSSQQLRIQAEAEDRNSSNYLLRLRQQMEKARLLCEMIRKREKTKRQLILVKEKEWEMTHRPFCHFLHSILNAIEEKDTLAVSLEPVNTASDYRSVVHKPMYISTMREKIDSFLYSSVYDLYLDFQHMTANCLRYYFRDTIYYNAALQLQEDGGRVFAEAEALRIELSESPAALPTPSETAVCKPVAIHSLNSDEKIETESKEVENLEPLMLVWTKQGSLGVWSPAVIVDPNMRKDQRQNGVPFPAPPSAILERRRALQNAKFLVMFFDNQPNWEWKGREELELLTVNKLRDNVRLKESSLVVQRAYERAIKAFASKQNLNEYAKDKFLSLRNVKQS